MLIPYMILFIKHFSLETHELYFIAFTPTKPVGG